MLHITLSDEYEVDPKVDELGRDRVGYSPTMSPLALYDANHGSWKLGERAQQERFYLATHKGEVKQAVEISSVEPCGNGRSVMHGTILEAGHPVYDKFVGKTSPVQNVRNPITYFADSLDARTCKCGCGEAVSAKDFIPGHDQTALHDRVRQVGTVAEFLVWFDVVRGHKKA